tara:strand:- start:139 stop:249 length:111 start_codon:yes stop_codon:yes gene_type:complete
MKNENYFFFEEFSIIAIGLTAPTSRGGHQKTIVLIK